MDGFTTSLIICVGVAIFIAITSAVNVEVKKKNTNKAVSIPSDFISSHFYTSSDGTTGLAIDEITKRLMLVRNDSHEVTRRILNYDSVLAVELIQDGSSITKTNRASQAAGMLVGGVLLGGAGLIVGGLSGGSKTTGNTTKIDLMLTINDATTPVHVVRFQHQESSSSGFVTKANLAEAQIWLARMRVIMHSADDMAAKTQHAAEVKLIRPASQAPMLSLADELRKLSELHRDGILSAEEFRDQKTRLLSI